MHSMSSAGLCGHDAALHGFSRAVIAMFLVRKPAYLEVFWEGAREAAPDAISVQLQGSAQLLHQPGSSLQEHTDTAQLAQHCNK